jgi:hypothetical protein
MHWHWQLSHSARALLLFRGFDRAVAIVGCSRDRDSMRFFTHVSFLLLFVIMLTLCVLSWLRRPWLEVAGRLAHEPAVPRGVIVTVWIVWEVMLNSALFLDIVYWALLADRDDVENPEFLNWMVHFGNFIHRAH